MFMPSQIKYNCVLTLIARVGPTYTIAVRVLCPARPNRDTPRMRATFAM